MAGLDKEESAAAGPDAIYREIERHSPHLADLYKAAVRLVEDHSFPARFRLAAHAVREIANALPEVLFGIRAGRSSDRLLEAATAEWLTEFPSSRAGANAGDISRAAAPPKTIDVPTRLFSSLNQLFRERSGSLPRATATEEFFGRVDPLNHLQKASLAPVIKDWLETTRWFVGKSKTPRTSSDTDATTTHDEREFQQQFARFEAALRGLLGGFFEVQGTIEAIVAVRGANGLDELLPLLAGAEQRMQFLNSLDGPEWLGPLEKKGFFDRPEEPLPTSPTVATHPPWPALRYLRRMATRPEAQKDVSRIAAALTDSSNFSVNLDLAEIALALPPDLALPLAKKATHWLRGYSHAMPRKVGELAVRLASSGHASESLSLLDALLQFERRTENEGEEFLPPRVDPLLPVETLQQILKSLLSPLVEAAPLEVVDLLARRLDAVLGKLRRTNDEAGEDYLGVSQYDVKRNARAHARFELVLVCELRDAMIQAAEHKGAGLAAVLARVEARRWHVFKRLAMHLLERVAEHAPRDVARYLADRGLLERLGAEYQRLLHRGFRLIEPAERETLLRWIEEGPRDPSLDEPADAAAEQSAREEIARESDAWRWRRLGLVRADLAGPWQGRWQRLEKEFGEPSRPGTDPVRMTSGQFEFTSPVNEVDWVSKSIGEQIAFLRDWRRPEEEPFVAAEGLRETIANAVSLNPSPYAREAEEVVGLRPTFVRGFVNGWLGAIEAQRPFPWEPVLGLGRWIVLQIVEEPAVREVFGEDPGWSWTRSAFARLLSGGFSAKAGAARLPLDLRPLAWDIIAKLVAGPSTITEQAIETLIDYVYWVRPEGATRGPLGVDVPEVAEALARETDPSRVHPPAWHQAVGRKLPWLLHLDSSWVAAHRGGIFPAGTEAEDRWRAAWTGFVTNPASYPHAAYAIVAAEYERAVEELAKRSGTKDFSYEEECLAQHLLVLYVWGDVDLAGPQPLMGRFFEIAGLALRKQWFFLAAEGFEEARKLGPHVIDRLTALWHDRVARAKTEERVREELPAFGWWFAKSVFDESWAFDQLDTVLAGGIEAAHQVVARLAELAPTRPRITARLLATLTSGPSQGVYALDWIEPARRILVEAIRSGDEEAYAHAMTARDRLGRLGFPEVKHLLPLSRDLDDPQAIPYFLWDQPMTVAQFRNRLTHASTTERERLLAKLLREARDTDVWKFTTPSEVAALWPRLADMVGRKRSFWEFLLSQWREKDLIAP